MTRNHRRLDLALNVLLPLGLLVGIWIFDDYVFVHARLSPLLSIIALAILAFKIRPRAMVLWGVVFFLTVAFRLYTDALKGPWAPDDITPYLRIASFSVGTTVTTMLCFYSVRLERNASEVLGILSKLPVPVLLSDASGTIIFTNEQAAFLLGLKVKEMIGYSYFTLLIHPSNQGRTIARYIEIIDSPTMEEVSIPLKVRGRDDLKVVGNLAHASFSGTKALITVLEVEKAEG